MTKTLRVDLADLEGIPHASGPSGTSVVVTAEYTSPVVLESDGKIILAPKSKTMGAAGRVDFTGIYASDSEEVREDHRGFAVRVKAEIREPNGATRTWARTVKPLEHMADTVRLGRLPSAEGLPAQWVSVDEVIGAANAAAAAASQAATDASTALAQVGPAATTAAQAAAAPAVTAAQEAQTSAQAAQTAATASASDASNAVTLAQQAQAAALEIPDANTAAMMRNPVTETAAALDDVRPAGRSFESFGATGDADDTEAVQAAVSWALNEKSRLIGRPGRTYTIKSPITVTVADGDQASVDMGGATLRFVTGGTLRVGASFTPYLTTTSAAGITRKGTKFTVATAAGVKVGDLAVVSSPVEWITGVPLSQTFVVSDVDTTTGEVWVEGRIAGDITPEQITAAGVTGSVSVKFYKLASRVELRNVTLESPDKDDEGTLVGVTGARRVLLDNVHVSRPRRTGVSMGYCGTVEVVGCSTSEHGYTSKDRGYSSNASDPGALAYGYGFLFSNCYSVQARGCNSYSGWHGFDVARGVTYSLWDGCITHKDAYGFSTHEGAWVMEIRNCEVIGGLGITCRSAELVVTGGRFITTLGRAISAHGSLQSLLIKDVSIEASEPDGTAQPIVVGSGSFPDYCYSAEPPTLVVDSVTMTSVTGGSVIAGRGDVILRNITVLGRPDVSGAGSEIRATTTGTGKTLSIDNVSVIGVASQFALLAEGFTRVDLLNSHQRGAVRTTAGSALLQVLNGPAAAVRTEQCSTDGLAYLVRSATGAPVTVTAFASSSKYLVLADSATTFKAAAHCRTSTTTLAIGGVVAPATSVGNVVVPD